MLKNCLLFKLYDYNELQQLFYITLRLLTIKIKIYDLIKKPVLIKEDIIY